MTPRPLTITGGKLVLPTGAPQAGALRVADGRIVALGDISPEPGDDVLDAKGALVTPGLVDLGVFAIDKPAFHFGGITRAALKIGRA
ncbi:MAG: dihydroorotase, partial [Novosphingobium sp.]|nr:dihydroorotase [Novosphingobium sp.]